jgi:hypothetical protein
MRDFAGVEGVCFKSYRFVGVRGDFLKIHVSFFSAGIVPTSTLPQDGSSLLHSKRQGSSWDTCQAQDMHMRCSYSGNVTRCGVLGCNHTLVDVSHSYACCTVCLLQFITLDVFDTLTC